MLRYARVIRAIQWSMVTLYLALLLIPALLPLPPSQARIFDHLAVTAQFIFWGLWWPFVLLSVVLVGRVWCGVFCPEGTLTEWASRHGRQGSIPRWVRWPGWPFLAFTGATLYGQMVSVYQYAGAALIVLGGSTIVAMVVGFLYGREKRIWCRYLCPVSGVFRLLAKLSPVHFRVDAEAWSVFRQDPGKPRAPAVNCAPLLPLRSMSGAANCHMCGRCSGYRNAIALAARHPNREIVQGNNASIWESALLLYGTIGLAMGAFHWSASPWFIALKQAIAAWVVDQGHAWSLGMVAPWWVLTNYPGRNDVLSVLDGILMIAYVGATALTVGTALAVCVAIGSRCFVQRGLRGFHHLAQSLIPLAGAGLFLGLSIATISALRFDGVPVAWVPGIRVLALIGASLWCLWLAWGIAGRCAAGIRRIGAVAAMTVAIGLVDLGWVALFWLW